MSNTENTPAETPPPGAKVIHMVFHDGSGNPDDDEDHERSENEIFYDEEIAPALRRLATLCKERDMSFLNLTEYDPGDTGETCLLGPKAGYKAKSAYMAIKSHGNVDTLIQGLYRHAEKAGEIGVSVYLKMVDDIMKDKRPLRL